MLAFAIRRISPARPVWIEHEGKHVGTCCVPPAVYGWVLRASRGVFAVMDMGLELRARRLVTDYCSEEQLKDEAWVEGLKRCITAKKGGLSKRLGGQRTQEAVRKLDDGDWEAVSTMMLEYYDKMYLHWQQQSEAVCSLHVECVTADADANAELLLNAVNTALATGTSGGDPVDGAAAAGAGASPGAVEGDQVAPTPVLFHGRCFCGEVAINCRELPRSVSYCHCTICRRLTGAPFSAQALFPASGIEMEIEPGGKLQTLQTSKAVTRQRCATCMAPVRANLFGGKFVAIPLGLLGKWAAVAGGDENPLQPQHHLHYAARVMDVVDGLPKYSAGVRPLKGKPSDMAGELHKSTDVTIAVTGKLLPETQTDKI